MAKYLFEQLADLSHELDNGMPTYPGDTPTSLEATSTITKDGMNLTKVILSSHAGTHIDAPSHFIENGITIDQIPARFFVGEAVVVDVSNVPTGSGISVDEIAEKTRQQEIRRDDIVLLFTGCSELWGNPQLEKNFTFISEAAARYLVSKQVRAVGIDSFSVDCFTSTNFEAHKEILGSGLFIIESIGSTLKQFLGTRILLICPPLKLISCDGAPCRCLAIPMS